MAADFSASLTVNSQDVESRGVFSAKVNYTGKSININKGIGNTSFTLNLDDSLDKIIEGSGVKFVVGSQELEGNFDLIQENGLVRLSMEGASVVVGDDSNDYINLKVKKGAALIDPEGIAIDATGDAEILLTNLSASGEYRVRVENYYKNVYATNAISTSISVSLIEGYEMAKESIESKKALNSFKSLLNLSQNDNS